MAPTIYHLNKLYRYVFFTPSHKVRKFVNSWALFVGVCSTFRKSYFSFELLKSTDDKCEENFHFV